MTRFAQACAYALLALGSVQAFAPGLPLRPPSSLKSSASISPAFKHSLSLGSQAWMPVATRTACAHRKGGVLGANMLGNLFGEDITVCKIQVAANCADRGSKSLLSAIGSYVDDVDTEDEESLSEFVSDVALALLRKEDDWISGKVEVKNVRNEDAAEDEFGQMSLKERAKIERETVNLSAGRDKSDERSAEGKLEDIGKPTIAVVTMILALYGKRDMKVTDIKSMRKALSSVGSDVTSSDSLLAAEVMWTPEEPWETITEMEIIEDYPDLIPF